MSEILGSAEKLQHQMAVLKKLVQQCNNFSALVAELAEKAPHDPAAQARLEKLQQAWDNGLCRDLKKLRESAKKSIKLHTAYKKALIDLGVDNRLTAEATAAEEVAPPQRPAKSVSRSRRFV